MRSVVIVAVATLALAAACSSKRGGAKKIPRDRDAMPVVVVDTTLPSEMTFSGEAEPNDSIAAANVLMPSSGIRGTIDGETDADYYKITLAVDGVIDAQVGGIDKVDLMLDVRNLDGKILAKSDRGPMKISEGLPNFPLAAGDYYLVVSEFVKKKKKSKSTKAAAGRQGPSPIYELTAKVAVGAEADSEREPNEDIEGAATLLIGDEHDGYIGWNDDSDMWKLGLDGFTENYSADIDITGVAGVTYTLEVLDGAGKPLLVRNGAKGGGLAVRNLVPDLSADAPRAHYVRIKAKRSNPQDRYRIKMSTRLVIAEDEEVEPNDNADTATLLRSDTAVASGRRSGFLTVGDEDFYYLEVGNEPALLNVSVSPPAKTDAKIEVGIVAGSRLGMSDRGKGGAKESIDGLPVGAGKRIWIRSHGSGSFKDVQPYELDWSVERAARDPAGGRVGDDDDDDDDRDGPSVDDDDDYSDE